MTKKLFTFFTIFVISFLLIPMETAQAALTITPWRIVFGSRDRSATVELLNTSDETHTYRLGWMILKATADGQYRLVPATRESDKDPHSVANMVIVSPRQVTIEAHGEQVIRLSLRRPSDLPLGEYRAHMTLTQLADKTPPQKDPNAKTMDLSLKVNLSFSIPIIVRQGEDRDLKVFLSNPMLKVQNGATFLNLDLNRISGKFSSYGTINVFWTPPGKSEQKIGTQGNIALYPELKSRHIMIPITAKDRISGGKIRVVYDGALEADGTKWAENTFPVGGK
jgi:P pilus assembly chaperone PapD